MEEIKSTPNVVVYIDPLIDVSYCNFYIHGIVELFGKKNIQFNNKYFNQLRKGTIFPFLIKTPGYEIKIIIDYADGQMINESAYNWSDVYGKINYFPERTNNRHQEKLVSLPPAFGIKNWGLLNSIATAGKNYIKAYHRIMNTRKFFSPYHKQLKYNPISKYLYPNIINSDYVFSMSTLWYSDEYVNNDEGVNLQRYNFFEACNTIEKLNFEGGFVYSMNRNTNPFFKKYIVSNRLSYQQYQVNTKKSFVVFNTPAWNMCHGWKLGEFLSLGKAIISTKIVNELPAPLEHGTNIHYVKGEVGDIKDAIRLIREDSEYRQVLEKGAYDYYSRFVEPTQQIKLLLQAGAIEHKLD
ncbi:MAG: hypothetical protein HQ565_07290 [Bacteroidetes bacterium]|nr:hypothetical protein [Bacteroidota bacterium]